MSGRGHLPIVGGAREFDQLKPAHHLAEGFAGLLQNIIGTIAFYKSEQCLAIGAQAGPVDPRVIEKSIGQRNALVEVLGGCLRNRRRTPEIESFIYEARFAYEYQIIFTHGQMLKAERAPPIGEVAEENAHAVALDGNCMGEFLRNASRDAARRGGIRRGVNAARLSPGIRDRKTGEKKEHHAKPQSRKAGDFRIFAPLRLCVRMVSVHGFLAHSLA